MTKKMISVYDLDLKELEVSVGAWTAKMIHAAALADRLVSATDH